MALIACKECGQQISSLAMTCPKCGRYFMWRPMVSMWPIFVVIALLIGYVSIFETTGEKHRRDSRTARYQLTSLGITYSSASLYQAIAENDKEAVQMLLEAGIDPNKKIEGQSSALALAQRTGSKELLAILTEFGAKD